MDQELFGYEKVLTMLKKDINNNIMKKKTFLVTGGTGFIGSNICELLIRKKYNVKIFDNNSRGNLGKIRNIKKKN